MILCANIILSHGLNANYTPSIFQHFFLQNAKKATKNNKDAYILDACIMNMKIPRFLLIFLKYTSYFYEYISFFHCCGAVFSDMRPPCVLLNNTVWLANTV